MAESISVILPTYRRPAQLGRCLQALERQTRPPDEVIVIVRATDPESKEVVLGASSGRLPVSALTIDQAGIVAAINYGLDHARGSIIALTDDDSEPWPDWLARIEAHFARDPQLGALGGRDWLYADGRLHGGQAEVVGRIRWHGQLIGNHHIGTGPPREVELLKGVNMSFRRSAIGDLRFDRRLKGGNAEWRVEVGFVLALRGRGWRVVYDPAVAVNHYHPAERLASDAKEGTVRAYTRAFNETLVVLEHLPPVRRAAYLVWAYIVGTRQEPGLAQWARLLFQGGPQATRRLLAAWRARRDARSAAAEAGQEVAR